MRDILDGLSATDREEVLASAMDLKNDKMWDVVFERVREHHVLVLQSEPTYSLTAVHAHASLGVLEQLKQEISLVLSAEKIARRRS